MTDHWKEIESFDIIVDGYLITFGIIIFEDAEVLIIPQSSRDWDKSPSQEIRIQEERSPE